MLCEVCCNQTQTLTDDVLAEVCCLFGFVYECLNGFGWLTSPKWLTGMIAKVRDQLSKNYNIGSLEAKFGFKMDPFFCGMLANLFANQFSFARGFSEFFDVLVLFLESEKLSEFLVSTATAIYAAKRADFERCDSLLEVDCVFKVKFFRGWEVNSKAIAILKEVHHVTFIQMFR